LSTEYTYPRDARLNSIVTYEYDSQPLGLPRVITHELPNQRCTFRYEFLLLNSGAVDLSKTDGYVPSLLADMTIDRKVAVWSNDRMWFLTDGELRPGFGFEEYRPPTAAAPWVLYGVVFIIVVFLGRWLLRSRNQPTRAAKTNKGKTEVT
jgi:hypothetical protein